jgi:hypothetical protein
MWPPGARAFSRLPNDKKGKALGTRLPPYQCCSRVHNLRVQVRVLYIQVRVRVQVPSKISNPNFSRPSPKYSESKSESKSEMIKYMYNHISRIHRHLMHFCRSHDVIKVIWLWQTDSGVYRRGGRPPPNRHTENHFLKKAKSVEKLGGGGTHYMLRSWNWLSTS